MSLFILGDPGAVGGAEDKVKTGGKKFDEHSFVLLLVEFFPAVLTLSSAH